jgi:hypothetical protein
MKMKKIIGVGFTTLLASIVFSACFAVINPPKSPLSSAGRITLNIDGLQPESSQPDVKARTTFPNDIDSFSYTITFSPSAVGGPVGESPVVKTFPSASIGITETLRTGFWDIDVEARFGVNLVGGASLSDVEILFNQTIEKALMITPVGGANGTFAWSITYDHFDLINEIEVEYNGNKLDALDSGDIVSYSIDDTVDGVRSASDNSLSPGYYTFKAVLKSPISGELSGRIEVVHIYPGLTTTLDWNFDVNLIKVTGVTLDKSNVTLNCLQNTSVVLTATIEPPEATDHVLIWSSDNETIATVSNGTVTALGLEGVVNIYAVTRDGGHWAVCTITVKRLVDVVLWEGDIYEENAYAMMLEIYTTDHGGPIDKAWLVPGTEFELTVPVGNIITATKYQYWVDGVFHESGNNDFWGKDICWNAANQHGGRLIEEIVCFQFKSGEGEGQNPAQITRVVLKNVPEVLYVVGP